MSEATFPGMDGKIAFTRHGLGKGGGASSMYTINPDGSGLARLGKGPRSQAWPSFSPSGGNVVFVKRAQCGAFKCFSIFRMRTEGGNRKRLTPTRNYRKSISDSSPGFAADGKRVVFSRSVNGQEPELWIGNRRGTGERRLTFNRQSDIMPSFSPQGNSIVYSHYEAASDSYGVWLLNPKSGDRTRVTDSTDSDLSPDFSPDGSTIVFSRVGFENPNAEIYVTKPDGTGLTRLTNDTRRNTSPVFAPSGKRIAFTVQPSFFTEQADIFTMNADGTNPFNVTADPQHSSGRPNWQRRR